MVSVEQKISVWQNKLLDMSRGNRLLNYKDTKSNVRILEPALTDLWQSFVVKEEKIIFPRPIAETAEAKVSNIRSQSEAYAAEQLSLDDSIGLRQLSLEETYNSARIPSQKAKDSFPEHFRTNLTNAELLRALRLLTGKAKTMIEEQGVNSLYLSFGMLNWTESESSRIVLKSPLVLVPVSLSIKDITSPYELSLHEDEITLNPTLRYKLEQDFGVALPEFSQDTDINVFFSQVHEKVHRKGWSISNEVCLSLLSFLKINMYKDLERRRSAICENAVVNALCGDSSKLRAVDIRGIDSYDHDANSRPEKTFQIVDADSSQQDAILLAQKGVSFVLQGPPGTGKSQTITNIIAEKIASGKKVLFVSEKMAALDVVYRRLSDAGLGDFCLTLHSHKANKKDTLAQLGKVLDLAQHREQVSNEAYSKLNALLEDRQELNAYADELHRVIEPLGYSVYQVNGILAALDDVENVLFPINHVRSVAREFYFKWCRSLSGLEDYFLTSKGDYRSNPWHGAKIGTLTHNLRQELRSCLQPLTDNMKFLTAALEEAVDVLGIDPVGTYIDAQTVAAFLGLAGTSPLIPEAWVLSDIESELTQSVNIGKKLQGSFGKLFSDIREASEELKEIIPDFSVPSRYELLTLEGAHQFESNLDSIIAEDSQFSKWAGFDDFTKVTVLYGKLETTITVSRTIKNDVLSDYERGLFDSDYNGIYRRFKTDYNSFLKFFKGQYWHDKKELLGYKRNSTKITDQEILDILNKLHEYSENQLLLSDHQSTAENYFGTLYDGMNTELEAVDRWVNAYKTILILKQELNQLTNLHRQKEQLDSLFQSLFAGRYLGYDTDWNSIPELIQWAAHFKAALSSSHSQPISFIVNTCQNAEFAEKCSQYSERIQELLNAISPEMDWFTHHFEDETQFTEAQLDILLPRLDACLNGMTDLEEWITYCEHREKCHDLGIGAYLEALEKSSVKPGNTLKAFQKRFFSLWLDQVSLELPAVAAFRRKKQEQLIENFISLDKLQMTIARQRIHAGLVNSLPAVTHLTSGYDDISILKRELGKQRRIKPVRVLFNEVPSLIMKLKPCLMMSPLTVSLFLESEAFQFDTVIFDEASQVCTENAVGAMIRGQQVIIAGDSHQLPPTNFFKASMSDSSEFTEDDGDYYDDESAFESVLNEAALLPAVTLKWHYRSRHEHLIAFSNAKIYDSRLITFPANIERCPDNGVEYIYTPNGCYDRGGRKGNIIEAEKVVDLIFEHFQTNPGRSLGVITFGEVQQNAIENILWKRRKENPIYERFFQEDQQEPFFIKSLENVQGDERDTIIFSIGYAKDASGQMRMNFGPLSRVGGERRLNVAITRAKYNVKLVGSIHPTDINTDKVSSLGPKLLRDYIDFAQRGPEVLEQNIIENDAIQHDSPFEESVYQFLCAQGFDVITQVGCSGYRIDIAVRHPSLSGRYVLGVECDGATYHSARTARERDRLRQSVLESMGWKIYRIWSTDWVKDPVSERSRLLEAVKNAIEGYIVPTDQQQPSAAADNLSPSTTPEFVKVEEKKTNEENPYNFLPYTLPDFLDFWKVKHDPNITAFIQYALEKGAPIHIDTLYHGAAILMSGQRVNDRIRTHVDSTLNRMTGVRRKGDFVYSQEYTHPYARFLGGREFKQISPEELANAMYVILKVSIGFNRENLFRELSRAYGFKRLTPNMSQAMTSAFEILISAGYIAEQDGKIVVAK